MSCEHCQDLLTELVCDELSASDAAAVRAHAKGCKRCGPALAKFERTLEVSLALPLLSPSPDVERRIMQAARGALQTRAKGPLRETSEAPRSGFLAWCARIGSWAMSPQVAMASVLLLVVGIGLYALPLGVNDEVGGLRASEEASAPATAPEPAASATAAPSPEPVAADERDQLAAPELEARKLAAKRARSASEAPGDAREFAGKKGGGADPLAYESKSRPLAKPKAAPMPLEKSADGFGDDLGALGRANARRDSLKEEAERAPSSRGPARKADLTLDAENAAGGARFAPPPPAAPAAAAPRPQAQASGSAQAIGSPSKSSEATLQQRGAGAAQGEGASQAASGLGQGIAAAQRGDLATAQKLLTPIAKQGAQPERAQASLWLARSLRAAGDCSGALVYYKPLAEAPAASRAVLDEAADCYERTGGGAQAKRLRARALPSAPAAEQAPASQQRQ